MAGSLLQAKRYSQAVFEIALEREELDQWQSDLHKLVTLAQNPDFVSIMDNPRFPFEGKSRLLDSQLPDIGPLARNLAHTLVAKGNFGLVSHILEYYQEMLDKYRGIEKAEVTTAIPLDEEDKLKLAESLSALAGKKIQMTLKVDPGILGGVIAKMGGKIIDGSTRSQLIALKNALINAGN